MGIQSTGSSIHRHRRDQKESFQITLPHMKNLWPDQTEVAEFTRIVLDFEYRAWMLGMRILSCFAEKLGFASDFLPGRITVHRRHIRAPCVYCTTYHWIIRQKPNRGYGARVPILILTV
ncbi:hypothetical protein P4S72_15010 [Vibrio sp. PP-XX7]